ncbi:MAG: anti-sigma F factor [Ruminococcaceae bacterium]|nr:anti-sigma F factor [Oscillospiraceae bacterium]
MKKRCINRLVCTLPALSCNESVARSLVAAFVSLPDPTIEELADIRCAVSEAVTNAIVHGYRGKTGEVYISVKLFDDRSVRIEVRDKGVGIADIKEARQPLFTTDKSGERSGMGFAVMEAFTDKLRVYSTLGRGTRVVLEKQLSKTDNG